MPNVETLACCGTREIDGISHVTSKRALLEIAEDRFEDDGIDRPLLIFTDVSPYRYGKRLASAIEDGRLGEVMTTKGRKNGNTGNFIRMWIWSVNQKAFKSFWNQHKASYYDDVDNDPDRW